jgi:pimeloyl-ACP methyl ester carboxylesterase
MSIRSATHRHHHVRLLLLSSLACGEGQLVAAPVGTPPEPLQAEKIEGGGGLNLAVYEGGKKDGPPIVFIHGFSGNYLTWERQFSGPLAAEFRLVAYDLRGHGASDKPLDAAKYAGAGLWAEDLDAVIRAKHLDRPVLVGWSYGGYVIADYVRKFGDGAIGGLVFLGSSTKNGTADAAEFLTPEVLALFPDVLSSDVRKSLEGTRALTRMFANPLADAAWELAYGSAMMVPPEVRAAMFSRVLDNDDVLASIRVPTLAIHGAADQIVRVSASRHTAQTVPNAELLVYDAVGHAAHLQVPERLDRDLAEFVRASR